MLSQAGASIKEAAVALDEPKKQTEFPATQEIEKARLQIQQAIGNGMLEAEATGKKLLVVLGETHMGRDSILLENMAIKAAHDLGITNAAYEIPQDNMDTLERAIDFKKPVFMALQVSVPMIRDVYGMNFVAMDKLPDDIKIDENTTMESLAATVVNERVTRFREANMFEEVGKLKGHAIAVTGAAHVPGFLQSEKLKEDYVVVALDIDNTNYGSLPGADPFLQARFDYMDRNQQDVTRVKVSGEMREKPLWECIEIAVGKEDADKLKNRLIEKGLLYTDAELASRIERLTNGANAFPNDPEIRLQRGMLHAVANNYLAASQDYLMASVLSPEDKKGFYRGHYAAFMNSIPPSVKDRILGNATPSFATAGMPTSGFSNPLRLSTIPSNLAEVSPALNEHVWNGGISKFIENGKATFAQIDEIFKTNPEALYALHHKNFIDAVNDGYISVEQVAKISEFDLAKLKSGPSGIKLREAVENIIGTELSPPLPKPDPSLPASGLDDLLEKRAPKPPAALNPAA